MLNSIKPSSPAACLSPQTPYQAVFPPGCRPGSAVMAIPALPFQSSVSQRKLNGPAQATGLLTDTSEGPNRFAILKKPSSLFKLVFHHLLLTQMLPGCRNGKDEWSGQKLRFFLQFVLHMWCTSWCLLQMWPHFQQGL